MYWPYYDPYQANINQRQERSYSEDLLQANIGRKVTAYMTYEQNKEWNARVFTGILRAVGRDYFVLRERQTGKDLLLLNINLDYLYFDDKPAALPNR